jgi:hypothetical protein
MNGNEPKYTFKDAEKLVWGYNKILYTFWVRERRKVFYDPGIYDYAEKFMSARRKI